jgi:diguanylate cyclase (GGDEF)-like protein
MSESELNSTELAPRSDDGDDGDAVRDIRVESQRDADHAPANDQAASMQAPTEPETQREHSARRRDRAAGSRDHAAEIRDHAADVERTAVLVTERARDSIIAALLSAGSAGRERAAADRAAAASDRQLAAADLRKASAQDSQPLVQRQRRRDRTAAARDRAADARDRAAAAEQADLLITERARDSMIQMLLSAAAHGRERAAEDRADAASDRQRAAADRADASADSAEARVLHGQAQLDGLTGAHRRDLGRLALEHEITRSRRSGQPFVLAFIDVDGLKELNDRQGHAAGDALLRTVVATLRSQLRSYDPVVRIGGDEFLCGFTNTPLEASRRRVEQIRAALKQDRVAASISVGLAVLGERDTLEKLIARADADMYSAKPTRKAHPR